MSFLGRFLGHRSSAYSEGVALLEEERFAEAADRLRDAMEGRSDAPASSLAAFHFRQALVSEGRRRLRAGQPDRARPYFSEAVENWPMYPDLHCLLGAARGRSGDWKAGLLEARAALRLNPDYIEARLLEAAALAELGRARESDDSLDKLRESGRRVDHWLIDRVVGDDDVAAQKKPLDLTGLLDQALSGRSEKEEVAAAVAECRAGRWDEGLVRFAALVARRPRYPDYRTRHAAAYFQLGRNEEALAEVEAALALNEAYRTAIDLKGLILADEKRVSAASDFLAEADHRLAGASDEAVHEDLFGAYLRGVLRLLTGRAGEVAPLFAGRSDLIREFARAELLLAAAEDLQGHGARAGGRLGRLADEWSAESIYRELLVCHLIQAGRLKEAVAALAEWPAGPDRDERPLYYGALIEILRDGSEPVSLPRDGLPELLDDTSGSENRIPPPAWHFLVARRDALAGNPAACWERCRLLCERGYATEQVVRWMIEAAGSGDGAPADWEPPLVTADSCLAATIAWRHGREDGKEASDLLARVRAVHPEFPPVRWLGPEFWLAPIRGWIG